LIKLNNNNANIDNNIKDISYCINKDNVKNQIEKLKDYVKYIINNINTNYNYIDKLIENDNIGKITTLISILFIKKFLNFIIKNIDYQKIELLINHIKNNNNKTYINKLFI